jgi:hypothetical protein
VLVQLERALVQGHQRRVLSWLLGQEPRLAQQERLGRQVPLVQVPLVQGLRYLQELVLVSQLVPQGRLRQQRGFLAWRVPR